jgi:hypothetical protein
MERSYILLSSWPGPTDQPNYRAYCDRVAR